MTSNGLSQSQMTSDLKIFGRSEKGSTPAFQKYIGCKKSKFSIFKSIFEKAREKYEKWTKSWKIIKNTIYRSQYTKRVKYHIYF